MAHHNGLLAVERLTGVKMPGNGDVEKALAGLIAGTRRVKRGISLAEILRNIATLRHKLGSLQNVAERAGLSLEMVRQFWSVRNLCPEVMKYVTQRKLESVDVAHRIAKLGRQDQPAVARAYLEGALSSRDVRDVVSYKRSHPRVSIESAICSVSRSRNIRHYVVLLEIARSKASEKAIRSRISEALGGEGVVSLDFAGGVIRLVLDKTGRRILAERAKAMGATKREFLQGLPR